MTNQQRRPSLRVGMILMVVLPNLTNSAFIQRARTEFFRVACCRQFQISFKPPSTGGKPKKTSHFFNSGASRRDARTAQNDAQNGEFFLAPGSQGNATLCQIRTGSGTLPTENSQGAHHAQFLGMLPCGGQISRVDGA